MTIKYLTSILFSLVFFVLVEKPIKAQNSANEQSSSIDESEPNFSSTTPTHEGFGVGARISGASLLNMASNPLIVVDGIPFDNVDSEHFDFSTADERDYARLIGISQNDIKTIAILTDESDKAIYGQRAADGVVAITTQGGKTGKLNVEYSYKNTISSLSNGYDLLNGDQYIALMQEAFLNRGYFPSDPEIFADDPNLLANTNWFDAVTQKGVTNDHHIALSGSTDKISYRWSAGYIGQTGVVNETGSTQFNSRLGFDYHPSKKIGLAFDFDLYNDEKRDVYMLGSTSDIIELATFIQPNRSIYKYDEDGNLTDEYFYRLYGMQGGSLNPVALADYSHQTINTYRYVPAMSFRYKPIETITYKLNAQYTWINNKETDIVPNELRNNYDDLRNTATSNGDQYYIQNQLTFSPKLGENHRLSTSLFWNINADDANYTAQSVTTIGADTTSHSGYFYNPYKFVETNIGIEAKYALLNRYFIDIMLRSDDLKIGDQQYDRTYFPSMSIKWVLSNESFLNSADFLTHLSLYANYGQNGSNILYADNKMIKTTIQRAGVNMAVFDSRLTMNFNLFQRVLDNRASQFYLSYPATVAVFPLAYNEYWHDKTNGWELNMNALILKQSNWNIALNLNLYNSQTSTTWDSDINYLRINQSPSSPYNSVYNLSKNEELGDFYGLHSKGVYPNTDATIARNANGEIITDINGDPAYMQVAMPYSYSQVHEGDAHYDDVNYDGIINNSDVHKIGNANPLFSGSGGPTISYKNFSMAMYFNFRVGNDIFNSARRELESMNYNINQSTATLNRWRRTGDITNIPRALYGANYNNLESDRYVESGSFLRLKALTFKYNVGSAVLQKFHLKSLECFVTCRNLYTWTQYQGADPDIWLNQPYSNFGYDNNYRAAKQEFTFGISLGI